MTGADRMPLPQGDYLPARRHGDLIYTSGMTPRRDGVMLYQGPVRRDVSLADYSAAVVLACQNGLTAVRALVMPDEQIGGILNMTVYIAAEQGFQDHAKLADFASAFLREQLGPQAIGARAAVGVATLPGNAPVEIQLIAFV